MRRGVRMAIAVLAITLSSCLAPQNSYMVGVDMQSWSRAESIVYDNGDTLSLRNLNIAIRYNDNCKEVLLPLKIAITTPDERVFVDTLALQLQHPATALTVATTESLPYRTKVVLNQKGAYKFVFEPLVAIRGVEAIGIELK